MADCDLPVYGTTRFAEGGVRIDDHPWTWPDSGWTSTRSAPSFQLVFPRAGAWTKASPRGTVVGSCAVAVCYVADEAYRYRHHQPEGRCTYVALSHSVLTGQVPASDRLPSVVPRTPQVELLHQRLLAALGEAAPSRVRALALRLVAETLAGGRPRSRGVARPATRAAHQTAAQRAAVFLAETWRTAPSLAEVAAVCAVSPFHLARLFRAETGLTLHAYVQRLRLHRSLELLTAGKPTVEIAVDLGFASRAHFSASFKRLFGVSPSEFRGRPRAATVVSDPSRRRGTSACGPRRTRSPRARRRPPGPPAS